MKISPGIAPIPPIVGNPAAAVKGAGGVDFAGGLSRALNNLNNMQVQADDMIARAVTGQVDDIHQVVLAVEKANMALQMGMAVRNKVIEAYQEIMHMQV